MPPIDILKKYYGFDSFRPEQERVIDAILNKRDAFVLMPTGGGKSVCYQVPAMLLDGLAVVVSPLIALMKDQVDALRLNGIPAAFLNSSMNDAEQRSVMEQAEAGGLKLLYIAPERLRSGSGYFMDFLKRRRISLFAVDEAHCISHWGHDFRPEYLQLRGLKETCKDVPVAAFTASADAATQKDILDKLGLADPLVSVSSFNRHNIHYFVRPKQNAYGSIVKYLEAHRESSGIIYALSRRSVEEAAERLREDGFQAGFYHAGLDAAERTRVQDEFARDELKIIAATIAFGMGIDKSNVRYVIHLDMPKNIESYYQETGRAGRDGLRSDAILYYGRGDVMKLRRFAAIEGNPEQSEIMLKKLEFMSEFAETPVCRRKYLLNYFGEPFDGGCASCDVCLGAHEPVDVTVIAQKALSAIWRLEERFGAGYVADFLRGAKGEKIWERHRTLKTYGVGADVRREEWLGFLRAFTRQGLLREETVAGDARSYQVLKLTDGGRRVLKGEAKVFSRKTTAAAEEGQSATDFEEPLFDALKKTRREIADNLNVPAYVVLHDAALVELARYLPQSPDDLRHISGFGEVKIERYGTPLLETVKQYCAERGLSSRIHLKTPGREKRRAAKPVNGDTRSVSLIMHRDGKTIAEIAQERGLTEGTVTGHLASYIMEGAVDVADLVPPEKLPVIEEAIKMHGTQALGALKRALGDGYSYGEIRAGIEYFRMKVR
ncbi:MAG: DNA helicase RecQ [Deltaproteobacteria bacterium]|nr:DNA helicase RecQ [Deltaproteobacteria bacterium]